MLKVRRDKNGVEKRRINDLKERIRREGKKEEG